MKFIFCGLLYAVLWSSSSHGLKKIRVGLGEPNLPLTKNVFNVEDKWFVQKLDHFNPTDNRTWKQVMYIKCIKNVYLIIIYLHIIYYIN